MWYERRCDGFVHSWTWALGEVRLELGTSSGVPSDAEAVDVEHDVP